MLDHSQHLALMQCNIVGYVPAPCLQAIRFLAPYSIKRRSTSMLLTVLVTCSRCGGNLTANELHWLSVSTFEVQTV